MGSAAPVITEQTTPPRMASASAARSLRARVGTETITLELALDTAARTHGLQGRPPLARRQGMLFVYPDDRVRSFWMPDCPVPIDVLFIDSHGHVLNALTMPAERPRDRIESNFQYEMRLPRYSSAGPAPFVIELRAGEIERLGVQAGDIIEFDYAALHARAR